MDVGAGKGKARRAQMMDIEDIPMSERCNNFPKHLLEITEDIILTNGMKTYRVGIFLHTTNNTILMITASGQLGRKLEYEAGKRHSFSINTKFPYLPMNIATVLIEANNAIESKTQEGYNHASEHEQKIFTTPNISAGLKHIIIEQQKAKSHQATLPHQKVTF